MRDDMETERTGQDSTINSNILAFQALAGLQLRVKSNFFGLCIEGQRLRWEAGDEDEINCKATGAYSAESPD